MPAKKDKPRNATLAVAVTSEEKEAAKLNARRAGKSISDLVWDCLYACGVFFDERASVVTQISEDVNA